MGPFTPSKSKHIYILVAADYVTKWVEAIPTKSVDHATTMKMLQEIIFQGFGVPMYLIINDGSHFLHGILRKTLAKYGVDHKFASPYHPQTSGQVEISNRELKIIFHVWPRRHSIKLDLTGQLKLMMLYGLIELLLKILWECLLIKWSMVKLVI
jgi:hypothetical protein